jgi:hypothetical protein
LLDIVEESALIVKNILHANCVQKYPDMLPNIGFWVDNAHIRLICTSVNQSPVIHLKEGIAGVVLDSGSVRHIKRFS